jgi:signal peptidase I
MQMSCFFRQLLAATAFVVGATLVDAAVVERPTTSVSLDTTLADAHRLAARHTDLQVLRIQGKSMLPFFGEGSVVVVKAIESAKVQPGMVVVYQNRFGETVAHRVIAAANGGWTVQGFNNSAIDSTVVNDSNLLGVVYATFHSNNQVEAGTSVADIFNRTKVAYAAPAK